MFGLFKKKTVIEKIKTNSGIAIVHYGQNEKGCITRFPRVDWWGDDYYIVSGKDRVESYLRDIKSFVLLDDGIRVPLTMIKRIDPIMTIENEIEVEA